MYLYILADTYMYVRTYIYMTVQWMYICMYLCMYVWYICVHTVYLLYSLLQEFFEFQSAHRSVVLSALARKYHAIGPLLIKMEGLVVYTNSGKSPRLKAYYAHWEKKIFDSIIKVCVELVL